MNKNVLVIGDIMLDVSIHGSSSRIAPEAPVPVVNINRQDISLGGAGNVLRNLISFGLNASIFSIIGENNKNDITTLLSELGVSDKHIIHDKTRKTTVKTRIIAQNGQVARYDFEDTHTVNYSQELLNNIQKAIDEAKVVIISDYGKGVCSPEMIKNVIQYCNKKNIKTIIDPKGNDITKYKDAYCITPNKKEAYDLLGIKVNHENVSDILKQMSKYIKNPIITLSEDGIAYLDLEGNAHTSKAYKRDVIDVNGAGDTVVASLAYAVVHDFDIHHAVNFANKAAAIVVSKLGTATATLDEITNFNLHNYHIAKIINKNDIKNLSNDFKGKKIVFTNGCFDILHIGHIECLKKAKDLGDILVIGINSDSSIKRLKGDKRPINNLNDRMTFLSYLSFVDFIIPFEEDTPYALIKELKPDILVKGGDYKASDVIGFDIAKETVIIPYVQGKSTTNILNILKHY